MDQEEAYQVAAEMTRDSGEIIYVYSLVLDSTHEEKLIIKVTKENS